MLRKRQGREEKGEDDSEKRLFFRSLEGMDSDKYTQELINFFEPCIRKLVKERVKDGINQFLRPIFNGVGCSGSRVLQLRFDNKLPGTLYTDSRVKSRDGGPIKLVLYDSLTEEIVSSGPLSSTKVNIVALSGDFKPDDQEGWSEEDFDGAIVHRREGKKPLLTGELTITLQNGVGQINTVIFTDNSSWNRSRRFRLGAKAFPSIDENNIREAMSDGFQVKDHRGESYEKHHLPFLHDEIWWLGKVAKDGVYHKKLEDIGVKCVGDFLRLYETNPHDLMAVLGNIPKNTWKAIINHAKACVMDFDTLNDNEKSDYLRKISLKMLTMETKSQNPMANPLQSNATSSGRNPQDPGASQGMQPQMQNQVQQMQIPLVSNQTQMRQQLLPQNIQNSIGSTGVPQGTVPNVPAQNPNMQNVSNVNPSAAANSMGQGVPSNIYSNAPRQIQGRQQQVLNQEQQQQSQNSQYLYNQQMQVATAPSESKAPAGRRPTTHDAISGPAAAAEPIATKPAPIFSARRYATFFKEVICFIYSSKPAAIPSATKSICASAAATISPQATAATPAVFCHASATDFNGSTSDVAHTAATAA